MLRTSARHAASMSSRASCVLPELLSRNSFTATCWPLALLSAAYTSANAPCPSKSRRLMVKSSQTSFNSPLVDRASDAVSPKGSLLAILTVRTLERSANWTRICSGHQAADARRRAAAHRVYPPKNCCANRCWQESREPGRGEFLQAASLRWRVQLHYALFRALGRSRPYLHLYRKIRLRSLSRSVRGEPLLISASRRRRRALVGFTGEPASWMTCLCWTPGLRPRAFLGVR